MITIILCNLLLVGCGGSGGGQGETAGANQAVLSGPIAGATVNAYRLTDLTTAVASTSTKGGDNSTVAGTFDLTLAGIADDEWILVAIRGGTDLGDSGTQTPNTGALYGLARASKWRQGTKLTSLTDILWRYSTDWVTEVSPQAFATRLDQIAGVLLQQDLDGNSIGASDLTQFNPRSTPLTNLTFDYTQLFAAEGFASKIHTNAPDAEVRTTLGDLFGPVMALGPPMQMEQETRISLAVFGSGSIALQSHDTGVTLVSGTPNNQLVDGQTLIEDITEEANDQRELYFTRSSQQVTFRAVPVGASYPEMDRTQILNWDGCDSVSIDQTLCTVDLQSSRSVTANFDYLQTTLVDNHRFIDLTDRVTAVLSNWNTSVDPVQMQLSVTVPTADTDMLGQLDALTSSPGFTYYVAGIDATASGTPFLLKILSVASHSANQWVLNAEEAGLADVILQGSGMIERTLYPEDLVPEQPISMSVQSKTGDATTNTQYIAYLVPSTDPNDPTFHIRIGQPVTGQTATGAQAIKSVSRDYTITGPNGTALTLSGSLDVSITVSTGIEFRGPFGLRGVKKFKFIPTLGVKPQVSVTGNISRTFHEEVTLITLEFTRIKFMVGPVPVWITPTVGIVLGADGHLSATVQTAVAYDMSVTGGVKYQRGHGWSVEKSSSVNRSFEGPAVTGNANLRAYLSVEPTLFIYDITGPGLKIQPGLGLNAAQTANPVTPECFDIRYALVGRVDGLFTWSIEGRLPRLLGLSGGFDFPIFHWETDLSRRSYNPCSNSPSALKVTGDTSQIVMVQNTNQDRSIQYTVLNNNSSPGYALPWSVSVIPNNGSLTVSQASGQLNAGTNANVAVQLTNTASLAPGNYTTRLVFTNTDSLHASKPKTVEKYVKVKVLEQLATPSITQGVRTGPNVVTIDWSYNGNVDYLESFALVHAVRADGLCPATNSTSWQKSNWASRTLRSISTVVPYGNFCFMIEALGASGSQLFAYSAPYAVVDINCDLDGDGYDSSYLPGCGGGDTCDDGNGTAIGCTQERASSINPGVIENNFSANCEDGIDNNCDGVDSFCAYGAIPANKPIYFAYLGVTLEACSSKSQRHTFFSGMEFAAERDGSIFIIM